MRRALFVGAANPELIARLEAGGWQVTTDAFSGVWSQSCATAIGTALARQPVEMLVVAGGPDCAVAVKAVAGALAPDWHGCVICLGESLGASGHELEAIELATRTAALGLAPRARLNAVVTLGVDSGAGREVAEALALAADSPAMTGVAILVAGESGGAADAAAPYRWPPHRG